MTDKDNCAECGKPLGSSGFVCHTCREEMDKEGVESVDESIDSLLRLGLIEPTQKRGEPAFHMTEAGRRFLDEVGGGSA